MSNDSHDNALYRGSQTSDPRIQARRFDYGAFTEPGRVPGQDSIEASQEHNPRDDDGFDFTGYDSQMATRIGDETDDDPRVERLRELHEGRHQSDGEHSAREAERDKVRIAQAICSGLPLALREREHVVSAIKILDLDRFGNQKNITKVTLGLVVVIADEQYRSDADDLDQLVSYSEEFRTIRDKHDISMSDLKTVKRIAREQLEKQHVPVSSEIRRRDPALPGPTAADDLPRQYWEELSAQAWASIARSWERHPQTYKEAIPDDYRETVDLLRRWEPWEEDNEEEERVSHAVDQPDPGSVDEDDDIDDLVVAEAEALVAEMLDAEDSE